MLIPKPSEVPAAKKLEVNQTPPLPKPVRKPFVRKPHLTDRSLRNHAGLQALKAELKNKK